LSARCRNEQEAEQNRALLIDMIDKVRDKGFWLGLRTHRRSFSAAPTFNIWTGDARAHLEDRAGDGGLELNGMKIRPGEIRFIRILSVQS
jgi:hypothetical protein